MKDFIIFVILTFTVLGVSNLYFEYCISRPFPIFLTCAFGFLLSAGILLYFIYTAKLLIKHLKL